MFLPVCCSKYALERPDVGTQVCGLCVSLYCSSNGGVIAYRSLLLCKLCLILSCVICTYMYVHYFVVTNCLQYIHKSMTFSTLQMFICMMEICLFPGFWSLFGILSPHVRRCMNVCVCMISYVCVVI